MGDKYYRLVTLMVEICPTPLRKLFLKYVYADTKHQVSSLGAYLLARKNELLSMKAKKLLREDQWDLLFPMGQADVTSWDTTLLALTMNYLFKRQLKPDEYDSIKEIRDIRNQLQHKPDESVSDADFDDLWKRLETATVILAKQIKPFPQYAIDIKAKIDDAKVNNMPKLGDTLRLWYSGIVKDLYFIISNMEEDMRRLKETSEENLKYSKESKSILEDSSVQQVGASGEKVKRLKTYDPVYLHLNRMFNTTYNEKLSSDFENAFEVENVKGILLKFHLVFVIGRRETCYFETALAAVRDLSFNHDRCVQMKQASDWIHIDPEDVDLVLCIDPFGDLILDFKKADDTNRIISNIYQATKPSAVRQHLSVVIVSDADVFQKYISDFNHEIQADRVVNVSKLTSVTAPVDLTYNSTIHSEVENNSCFQNLVEMSVIFAESFNQDEPPLSKTIVNEAKAKLKQHKVIVITGPQKCGKTTLSALLASVYRRGEYLIITKADEMKCVSLNKVCLLVIEDFAGKCQFDSVGAGDWMRKFDFLDRVVKAGKLNVIITCEDTLLDKCNHSILHNVVQMNESDFNIKQEIDENSQPDSIVSNMKTGSQQQTNQKNKSACIGRSIGVTIQTFVMMHINTTSLPKNSDCRITELCLIAVSRNTFGKSSFEDTRKPSLPRVNNKLIMCFNPEKHIQEEATAVSELTIDKLCNQTPFTMDSVFTIKSFLSNLQQPFCFIAHNGDAFDFKVFKAELKRLESEIVPKSNQVGAALYPPTDKIGACDEVEDFEDEATISANDMQFDRMLCADSITFLSRQLLESYISNSKALRSLYQEMFRKQPKAAHTAEGFCMAMFRILQKQPNFQDWVDKNAKRMAYIKPAY